MTYPIPRGIVEVQASYSHWQPYAGDFSLKGYTRFLRKDLTTDEKLARVWLQMMLRCYDTSSSSYYKYGGIGAHVQLDWHQVDVFIKEVKKIPHWEFKLHNWDAFQLDKDYYGAMCYGLTTAVWVSSAENNVYREQASH